MGKMLHCNVRRNYRMSSEGLACHVMWDKGAFNWRAIEAVLGKPVQLAAFLLNSCHSQRQMRQMDTVFLSAIHFITCIYAVLHCISMNAQRVWHLSTEYNWSQNETQWKAATFTSTCERFIKKKTSKWNQRNEVFPQSICSCNSYSKSQCSQ